MKDKTILLQVLKFPEDLHKKMRVKGIKEKKTATQLYTEATKDYLEKK